VTEGTPQTSLGPLVSIGHVRTGADDETVRREWESLVSRIEVLPAYEPALLGVDGFSHLIVVSWLDRIEVEQRQVLQVKPRGLLRFGVRLEELPTIGCSHAIPRLDPTPSGSA
jgi:tRNA (Thr-GGU) A37 N-methylase